MNQRFVLSRGLFRTVLGKNHYLCMKVDDRTKPILTPQETIYRPKIQFRSILFTAIFYLIISMILSVFSLTALYISGKTSTTPIRHFVISLALWWIFWSSVMVIMMLKKITILSIRIYQCYASAEIRLKCCFEPSCSEYAILAINKHGLLIGTYKTIKRLFRCKPPFKIDFP